MDESDEMGTKVELYVYDLTKGMAATMSRILIGESPFFLNIIQRTNIFLSCRKENNTGMTRRKGCGNDKQMSDPEEFSQI